MIESSQTDGLTGAEPRRAPMRLVLVAAVMLGATLGLAATRESSALQAAFDAGEELTRLLRAMAVLKVMMVAAVVWLVDWRLRYPISGRRAASYVAGAAVMATGPGLIWSMAHVALGAALLHGAMATLLVLFCRDPGSPAMAWAARRPR